MLNGGGRFGVAVAAGILMTQAVALAKAADPDAVLVAVTRACPEATRLEGGPGEPIAVVYGAAFSARADSERPRERLVCGITLRVNVPPGFQALIGAPEILGASAHDADGGANLSVRWYAAGEVVDDWFRRISCDAASAPFATTPPTWEPRWYACGVAPELNLLIDLSAHLRTVDAARYEAVSVQQARLPGVLFRRCQ
jgi:hypothetical protein